MTGTKSPPHTRRQGIRNGGLAHEMWLYDVLDTQDGVSSVRFVQDLAQAKGGPVNLHISSPGGDVFEGMAIFEALRTHPGYVTVFVDGLAASAASVVAMAADEVVMAPNAMIMIHDAWSMTIGDEADHLAAAAVLGQVSDLIAACYAARAGDLRSVWRDRMRVETWYSASEAVAAGLADRVATSALVDPQARAHRDAARADFKMRELNAGRIAATVREAFRSARRMPVAGVPLHRPGAPSWRSAHRDRCAPPTAMPAMRLVYALALRKKAAKVR